MPERSADANCDAFAAGHDAAGASALVEQYDVEDLARSIAVAVGGGRVSAAVMLFKGLLPLEYDADVLIDYVFRLALGFDAAVQQKNRPVGKLLHQTEIVRNEKDGGFLFAQLFEFANAPVGKDGIADRERFVHDQNVGVDVNGG